MSKPDWKDAPPNATHLAMDMDGDWHWFDGEPLAGTSGLWIGRIVASASELVERPEWTRTLERRP